MNVITIDKHGKKGEKKTTRVVMEMHEEEACAVMCALLNATLPTAKAKAIIIGITTDCISTEELDSMTVNLIAEANKKSPKDPRDVAQVAGLLLARVTSSFMQDIENEDQKSKDKEGGKN